MTFKACYQDIESQMWEEYSIQAVNESAARKEAERIARMEKKVLILFEVQEG